MKRVILPLCLLVLLTINSCIDLSQNITINADGSGTETSTITFDREFMDMITSFATSFDSTRKQEIIDSIYDNENFIDDMREEFDSVQGITLINMSAQTNPDSSKTIYFSYNFSSIDVMQNLFDSRDANDAMKSTVSYVTNGDNVTFRLTYSKPPEDNDGDTTGTALKEEIGKLFKNDLAHTTVNFPFTVVSTNGQQNGNSVTWNIPMETLYDMKEPVVLEAMLKK